MTDSLCLHHHGLFVARTPLLPLSIFDEWAKSPDRKQFVRERYRQPLLQNALYVASPSLFDRTRTLLQEGADAQEVASPQAMRQLDEEKLYFALSKYLARAAYRCTPFGLFASITPGSIGGETGLASIDDAPPVARVRFDFAVQAKIAKWLMSDLGLRSKLCYRANDSISSHGDKIFFVEGIDGQAHKRYHFNQVERDTYLDGLLAMAQQHTPFVTLRQYLMQVAAVSDAEADGYLHELIDSELLLPDLGLHITGPDSFATLFGQLDKIGEAGRLMPLVQALAQLPSDAGQANWAEALDALVIQMIESKQFEAERKNVFQVDAKRVAGIALSEQLVQTIARACQLQARLCMRRIGYLDDFKRRFAERYEEREVPLDWLFNDEVGIPFPKVGKPISDLLSGIDFPAARGQAKEEVKWDALDRLMFRKYEQALRAGAAVIDLTEQDVQEVAGSKSGVKLPTGGLFVVASLFAQVAQAAGAEVAGAGADGAGADGAGQYGVYLQTVGGRTGVEMLGRFCDLDPALTGQVRSIIGQIDQNNEQTIYAEVVHLPQDRVVNVVARPVLSEYEIPYLGRGGVPDEKQIPVSDLLVSLQNNRFVLRSRRLNKQVIPRLTSAHNYGGNNLNIYHFLCSLTWQDQPSLGFEWSPVFRAAQFLPRVAINGVVLSLATWRLDKGAMTDLRSALGQGRDALLAWREARRMPRFVSYDVFDNVLPVDLENALMVQMLLDEVGQANAIEVKEALGLNAAATVATQDGAAAPLARNIELVIPYRIEWPAAGAAKAGTPAPQEPRPAALTLDPRHMAAPYLYLPGSEWTYFKIYCGQSQADELLVRYLGPLMRGQMEKAAIESWFFIRYADPEHHVRLRAKSASPQAAMALGLALSQLCQRALAAGLGWRVVADSYEREVVRYGGLSAMEHCERLFHLDSELVLDFIGSAETQIPVSQRWLFGVFCVTRLLDGFYPDRIAKAAVIRSMAESFRAEFNFGARQKVQLGSKYRSYRAELDKLVFGRNSDTASEQQRTAWQALIARYAPAVDQQVAAILQLQQQGQLEGPLGVVVRSLVHMHCNRLFIANQRAHEVVFYDFLERIEGSFQAAARSQAGN